MSYQDRKVFDTYKTWIIHVIMSFLALSLTFGLGLTFLKFLYWMSH